MRGGRRFLNRPGMPLDAHKINNLPGLTKVLRANHIGRSEPDPYYDAPDGYRRFNPVIKGPAADKLIRRIAGPTVEELKARGVRVGTQVRIMRCSCCKIRPRRKASMLCGWCAWLLQ